MAALAPIIDKVWAGIERGGLAARTVTLKVKFSDFSLITRAASPERGFAGRAGLASAVTGLLRGVFPFRRSVRLLGVSVSRFEDTTAPEQALTPDLFERLG